MILHTGNMGKKQDLLNVVRAAELSAADPELLWVIVGEGEERTLLEREIKTTRAGNLLLLPLQPAESLCQLYAAADVLLLNQKAAVKDAVIPSKLLDLHGVGPAGAVRRHFRERRLSPGSQSSCGAVVAPENPEL